jgi:hypothetical protein
MFLVNIHWKPKNVHHLRGFKFTVVRVRFNDFKILVKRQVTLVLNIKWKEKPKKRRLKMHQRVSHDRVVLLGLTNCQTLCTLRATRTRL